MIRSFKEQELIQLGLSVGHARKLVVALQSPVTTATGLLSPPLQLCSASHAPSSVPSGTVSGKLPQLLRGQFKAFYVPYGQLRVESTLGEGAQGIVYRIQYILRCLFVDSLQ